ncbi:MAG: hypothetical protein AB7I27_07545 [Bacteriovoracaceae bacterium]
MNYFLSIKLKIIFIISLGLFSVSCFSQMILSRSQANFDLNKLACDISKSISSKENFDKRLINASKMRSQIFKNYEVDNFYQELVYSRSRLHSFPLIDFEKFWNKEPPRIITQYQNVIRIGKFPKEIPLFIKYMNEVNSDGMYWEELSKDDLFYLGQFYFRAGLKVAEPLFNWLIIQPEKSVSVHKLIEQAKKFYQDDIITSLGVIGLVFFSEVYELNNREQNALLSKKMIPLFKDIKDPIGANYHFWAYLNLSLQQDRVIPLLMSVLYEGIYQFDLDDLKVDLFAINLGRQVVSNLNKGSCQ